MQKSSIRETNRGTCFKHTANPLLQRLRDNHQQLKTKYKNKVSINCRLRCIRKMAMEHLDVLGSILVETRIAPDLEKTEPEVWSGKIDTA